jgi:hypothetical protein
MRTSIENHGYQVYMTDVRALNTVKDFLAQHKDTMSKGNRDRLIQEILRMHRKIRRYEREHQELVD